MPWLGRTGHHRRRWPCDAQPIDHPSINSPSRMVSFTRMPPASLSSSSRPASWIDSNLLSATGLNDCDRKVSSFRSNVQGELLHPALHVELGLDHIPYSYNVSSDVHTHSSSQCPANSLCDAIYAAQCSPRRKRSASSSFRRASFSYEAAILLNKPATRGAMSANAWALTR